MKIIQVNTVLNTGSTGRIAEQIGEAAIGRGHTSLVAYGRWASKSASRTYKVGGLRDVIFHGVESLLFDRQGLASRGATAKLVAWLEIEKPDAIGLHNLHGYFLNFPILFDYLRRSRLPVVWTLHDCWPFTGHCSNFDRFHCSKWEDECFKCPMTYHYPRSLLDHSRRNFRRKKDLFIGLADMTLVTPSKWLRNIVGRSFLSEHPIQVINNGVDLDVFKPVERDGEEILVLGVANVWSDRKGLEDFKRIRESLPPSFRVVLIGVTELQKRFLPKGIEGISRTESVAELVNWYQKATVFVNPTYSDNFPTTNIEALACGVPVVTYQVGGSPEALDDLTGRVVSPGDLKRLASAIVELAGGDRLVARNRCRARAEKLFNKDDRFSEYIDLYESLVSAQAD